MSLGLVIIGRNEAVNLRSLIGLLAEYPFDDIVYVDSDSEDESVPIARSAGWRVVSLKPNGVLSASAGRAIGTKICETDWIMYLDGDMRPNLDTLAHCKEYLQIYDGQCIAGITGDIMNVYSTHKRRILTQKSIHGSDAIWFGGAVILKRQLVLAAGNWNPNVYANEELDLYARLRKLNSRVLYIHEDLAYHHTNYVPLHKTALKLLDVFDCNNSRAGSLGLAVRSAIKGGSFREIVSLNPEPFVVPIFTMLDLSIFYLGSWIVGAALFVILFLWVARRRGIQYFPVCYLLVLHIIIGLLRYRDRKVYYFLLSEE